MRLQSRINRLEQVRGAAADASRVALRRNDQADARIRLDMLRGIALVTPADTDATAAIPATPTPARIHGERCGRISTAGRAPRAGSTA